MMNFRTARAWVRISRAFFALIILAALSSPISHAGEKAAGDGLPPLLLDAMNDLDSSGVEYAPDPPGGATVPGASGNGNAKAAPNNSAGKSAAVSGDYDVLPLTFAEMDKYDQIAMESYRDRYDTMTIGEKAKVYGKVFEFMHDRPPRFEAKISSEEKRFTETSTSRNAIAAKQFMYKPPTPKKKRGTPAGSGADAVTVSDGALLGRLSGPWGGGQEGASADDLSADPAPADPAEPSYDDYKNDNRMENLRQGWNAADVLRGRRER